MAETFHDIAALDLPCSCKAVIREVTFEPSMKMTRLILHEGKRIPQVDLDAESARRLADALTRGAGPTGTT